jgi:hypothetical protein
MNTTANSTRTASIAAVWADVRNAQRRMSALNRPWIGKNISR